jgi:hypothetical protein
MANLTLRSVKGTPLTYEELDGNFEYFTGSIDAINDTTGSFLTSADTSSFLTSADTASFLTSTDTGSFVTATQTGSFITAAQTGSFITAAQTGSMNITDTKYTVNTALSASGSTQSTTSVCSYGVNVFEYVTLSNIATKLPQPVTGKSVKIVNLGNTLLKVYPSNVGGRINNLPINEPAILPPDGKLYEFICIENPLPGAWTFSTPATGQYDSGEISISIDTSNPNSVVTAINSEKYGYIRGTFGGTMNFNSKNLPSQWIPSGFIIGGYNGNNSFDIGLYFRPDTPWECISKIKVYTNLIQAYDEYGDEINMGGDVSILACGRYEYYDLANPTELVGNNGGAISQELFDFYLNKTIYGEPITGSTAYTSANIGDPGTLWGEIVKTETTQPIYAGVDAGSIGSPGEYEGTFIGNKSLGTVPYPYTGTPGIPQGTPVEYYYSSYISFQMNVLPYDNVGTIDLKFRFVIEYY